MKSGFRRFEFGLWGAFVSLMVAGVQAGEPAGGADAPSLQPTVKIHTSLGDITLDLDAERAPLTVINFIDYAREGFYSGTIFHRVVKGRMIHGGGYTGDLELKTEGLRDPVRYEGGNELLNRRGTIAVYRRFDDLNSAQSQFFINTADNDQLDRLRDGSTYVVFGRVVDGMDVADRIENVAVGARPGFAAGRSPFVPVEAVVIKGVEIVKPLDRSAAEAKAASNIRDAETTVETRISEIESETGGVVEETKSGLRYIDVTPGNGAFPNPEDALEINYIGTFVNRKEFDSSQSRSEGPMVLQMAGLIRGLREGLQTMRESGRRIIIVPPELGFGVEGMPGRIPSGATLFYDVELVSVRRPDDPLNR